MGIFLRNHTGTLSSFYKLRVSVFPSKYITFKLCRHNCQVQCSSEPWGIISNLHPYWIMFFDLITSIEFFSLRACSHRSGYLQDFLILIPCKTMISLLQFLSGHHLTSTRWLKNTYNLKYDFILAMWFPTGIQRTQRRGISWAHMSVINKPIKLGSLGSLQPRKVLPNHLTLQPSAIIIEKGPATHKCRAIKSKRKNLENGYDVQKRLGMQDKMPKIILFVYLLCLEMESPSIHSKKIQCKINRCHRQLFVSCFPRSVAYF